MVLGILVTKERNKLSISVCIIYILHKSILLTLGYCLLASQSHDIEAVITVKAGIFQTIFFMDILKSTHRTVCAIELFVSPSILLAIKQL